MNHVDKDSRPDLLEGINVKMEPGREEGGGILNQEEQVQVWTPSVTSSRKPAVRIGGKHRGGSHFNLFVNGRGKVELGESLPFL